VTVEKFEINPMLVNVNKLKPYKYMESEVQKKRITNVNVLGMEWKWSLGGEF
jgi:hypothetical protein